MKKTTAAFLTTFFLTSVLMCTAVFAASDLNADTDRIAVDEHVRSTAGFDVNVNEGTIDTVSQDSLVDSNTGTIGTVEQAGGEEHCDGEVWSNSGEVNNNNGIVDNNFGTVNENGSTGVVKVNYPEGTVGGAGVIEMNLDDASHGDRVTVQKQMWQIVSDVWDAMEPSGTRGDYWVWEDYTYRVWVRENTGVVNLRSRNGKITDLSFSGGGDNASVVPIGDGVWRITGLTSILRILGVTFESIEPEPVPVEESAAISPSSSATQPATAVYKANFFETIKPGQKAEYIANMADGQIMIGAADGARLVSTSIIADTAEYRDRAVMELTQSGRIFGNLDVVRGVRVGQSMGGTGDILMKVNGLNTGDVVWLMFIDNLGNATYYLYLVKDPDVIETSVPGLSLGGEFVVLKQS